MVLVVYGSTIVLVVLPSAVDLGRFIHRYLAPGRRLAGPPLREPSSTVRNAGDSSYKYTLKRYIKNIHFTMYTLLCSKYVTFVHLRCSLSRAYLTVQQEWNSITREQIRKKHQWLGRDLARMQFRFGRIVVCAQRSSILAGGGGWCLPLSDWHVSRGAAKEHYAGLTLHGTNSRMLFQIYLFASQLLSTAWSRVEVNHQWQESLLDLFVTMRLQPNKEKAATTIFWFLFSQFLYSLFSILRNASHLSFDQMSPDTEALGLLDSWEFKADISF